MTRARRARKHRGTITVDVDVDIDDLLNELDDDDLVEELKARGVGGRIPAYKPPFDESLIDELRTAIKRGKLFDALLLVERLERAFEKPHHSDDAAVQMLKLAPRDPVTGQPVIQ